MRASAWVELDGREAEGGGSILRQALGFSVYTGRPFVIHHIRENRPNPGLRPQHLHAVLTAAQFADAEVHGATPGSRSLRFRPRRLRSGMYEIDIGTAGSVTLVLQAILLPAVLSGLDTTWTVTGGTDVPWSIPVDYFRNVTLFYLERWADLMWTTHRRGYYPRGEGHITLRVRSRGLRDPVPLVLDTTGGRQVRIVEGVAHASRDLRRARVAHRMAARASQLLSEEFPRVDIRAEYADTVSTGAGITLWLTWTDADGRTLRFGSAALGRRGVPAEKVAETAVAALLAEWRADACVDRYLADQLIPFLACVGGRLRTSVITPHTLANVYVARRFFPEVSWEITATTITAKKI